MTALPPTYVLLDAVSALLTLVVAFGFAQVARWSRQGLHALLGFGFVLLAFGFLAVSASYFGPGGTADAADALRLAARTGGAVLLAFAYAGAKLPRREQLFLSLGGTAVLVIAVLAALWLVPPTGELPPPSQVFAAGHALVVLASLACFFLSGSGWHRRPTWGRAMVPLGFLCWTFSAYTWIFLDLWPHDGLLPVVYAWRFLGLFLMLWALVRRPRPWPREAHAPT